MPTKWNWPLESPLKLRVNARSFDWDGQALPAKPVVDSGGTPERITLIRYGCAKFRVSMLPITERTFQLSGLEKLAQPTGN